MRSSRSNLRCRFKSRRIGPEGRRPLTFGITGSRCSVICSGDRAASVFAVILDAEFSTTTADVDFTANSSSGCDGEVRDTFDDESTTGSWTADDDGADKLGGSETSTVAADVSTNDSSTNMTGTGTDSGTCSGSDSVFDGKLLKLSASATL